MWFRLALEMGCTVLELKQRMTHLEFRAWCAYYAKEPFGFFAQHFHAGLIASTIDNCRQTYKRRAKWASISDYMPFVKNVQKRKPLPTAEQFIGMLKTKYAMAGKELEIIDNRGKQNG
jgi:hypothetical protein